MATGNDCTPVGDQSEDHSGKLGCTFTLLYGM